MNSAERPRGTGTRSTDVDFYLAAVLYYVCLSILGGLYRLVLSGRLRCRAGVAVVLVIRYACIGSKPEEVRADVAD